MRAELEETLADIRPDAGQLTIAGGVKRPELAERIKLWDLAVKLARELGRESRGFRRSVAGGSGRGRRYRRRSPRHAAEVVGRRSEADRVTRRPRLPRPRWETPLPAGVVGSWGPLVERFARASSGSRSIAGSVASCGARSRWTRTGGSSIASTSRARRGNAARRPSCARSSDGRSRRSQARNGRSSTGSRTTGHRRGSRTRPCSTISGRSRGGSAMSARRARAHALSRDPLGRGRLAPRVSRREPRRTRRDPRLLDRSRAIR